MRVGSGDERELILCRPGAADVRLFLYRCTVCRGRQTSTSKVRRWCFVRVVSWRPPAKNDVHTGHHGADGVAFKAPRA